MKRGKVGTGGREIMHSLYGTRGRPETNAYADLCAERQQNLREAKEASLTIREVITPRAPESPRTSAKWAKARAIHANLNSGAV